MLQARLARVEAKLESARKETRFDITKDIVRDVERAKGELAEGLRRDAVQAERPDGCWCLGIGGKDERYTSAGAQRFSEYCSCPDGIRVKQQHDGAARQAIEERERKRLAAGWEAAQLPKRFTQYRLSTSPLAKTRSNIIKLLTYPKAAAGEEPPGEEWEEFGKAQNNWLRSWFLFGPYGTGKTGLAVGFAWEYLEQFGDIVGSWTPVLFKSTPDLFSELRDTYNGKGESEQDVIKKFVDVPLLILDDLGAEHVRDSGWLEDRLYQIVGKRHGEEQTTVFTSNLSLEKLAAKIGERVTWRIVEMCGSDHIIKIDGPNLRDR